MLKRLYVNNYKALVNFEITFGPINLFLGDNGSGKSGVFEVLDLLRKFITNDTLRASDLFAANDLTRWMTSPEQKFELDLEVEGGLYHYQLLLEHNRNEFDNEKWKARVKLESLSFNGQLLMNLENNMLQLFRDDGKAGANFNFDWNKSALAFISERHDNQLLSNFKRKIRHLLVLQPLSFPIQAQTLPDDIEIPSYHLDDFISWYHYLENDGTFRRKFETHLQDIFPDFEAFSWEKLGRTSFALLANFKVGGNGKSIVYDFMELSDGQRNLVILYTLLHLANHRDNDPFNFMLCIDEPESALSLLEIQPWLQEISEVCMEAKLQIILISHHPRLINYLVSEDKINAYWFERESNTTATRIKPITYSPDEEGLPLSELLARGWFDPDEG